MSVLLYWSTDYMCNMSSVTLYGVHTYPSFINPYFSPEDIFIYLNTRDQVKRDGVNGEWLISTCTRYVRY